MRFTKIKLTNWRNFRQVEVDLPERAFLIGPNASGKSSFLDVFRFLRDIATPSGGIQRAVQERGGLKMIRSLHARNPSDVMLFVELNDDDGITWAYEIGFSQQGEFPRQGEVTIKREWVARAGETLLERPDTSDRDDKRLLEQSALEDNRSNRPFRVLADHFEKIAYLHLVPQFIRGSRGLALENSAPDAYGGRFLEMVNSTPDRQRKKILKRIEAILQKTVPQLSELRLTTDARGVPHLEATFSHWRPQGGHQNESQFSDGTLRLIGLLWMLQEGSGLMLMEEPELSLHQGIVR